MNPPGATVDAVSQQWFDLLNTCPSYDPSSYEAINRLDEVPSLSFLKDLIWQEIRDWVRGDTYPMSLVTHQDLEGPGRLYLGGMSHALNDQLLQEKGISAVITIHPADLLAWDERDPSYGLRRYRSRGCPVQHHLMIPLEDKSSSNLAARFDETYDFIRHHLSQGHGVLIHCKSGRSRSFAVAIAYLQRKHYETAIAPQALTAVEALSRLREYSETAVEVIRQQRAPVSIITERFMPALRLYELQLVGHPDYELERRILYPDAAENGTMAPAQDAGPRVEVKSGGAVLKICIAIVFFSHRQRPPRAITQRLLALDEAYFFELEGSEYNGRSYAQSPHAHRGIVPYFARFADEYGIAISPAISTLLKM